MHSEAELSSSECSTYATHDTFEEGTRLEVDFEWLNQAANECANIRGQIESKLQTLSTKSIDRTMLKQKSELISIVDLIMSRKCTKQLDGLLLLTDFFTENQDFINWDKLILLFLEVMRLIPNQEQLLKPLNKKREIQSLLWNTACFCISHMCKSSALILEEARTLDAVPRILSLLKYVPTNQHAACNLYNRIEDNAVRNSACRALSVLTASHSELKLVLLGHEATHTVLLQRLSSFDDDLRGMQAPATFALQCSGSIAVVAMTLIASCVYGSTPAVKETLLPHMLLRSISASILELPNQAPVGRAACILLCNVLAGCDINVEKARSMFSV
jgi:hypothetical protein